MPPRKTSTKKTTVEPPAEMSVSSIPSDSSSNTQALPPSQPAESVVVDSSDVISASSMVNTEEGKPLTVDEEVNMELTLLQTAAKELGSFACDLEKSLKRVTKLVQRKLRSRSSRAPGEERRETNFTKKMKVSEAMAKFLGNGDTDLTTSIMTEGTTRVDIVKGISEYSKAKDLKLASDKRVIILDAVLSELLSLPSGEHVRFCDVQKYIKQHFV